MQVSLREGLARFSLKEGVKLDPRAIREAISKINFTPKELRVRLQGQLGSWTWPDEPAVDHPEATALKIETTGQLFLLSDPPDQRGLTKTPLKRLIATSLDQKRRVVVTGTIHQHTASLPLGLVVESFELAP